LHRQWDGTLFEPGWSAVSCPVEYGGRGTDYLKWLIFEEEYLGSCASGRASQNGIFLLGRVERGCVVRLDRVGEGRLT
jgi:alkylation response protein AidB-like acyl-CoA dehydrogenase